jgi:hypothetical protein
MHAMGELLAEGVVVMRARSRAAEVLDELIPALFADLHKREREREPAAATTQRSAEASINVWFVARVRMVH